MNNSKKNSKPKAKKQYTVRICTSQKSCGGNYGPYIWERLCNEHDQNSDQESFESNGIIYEKSQCQGHCKKSSNVQVTSEGKVEGQFHYMNPIKTVKLSDSIKNGANPGNIKRL